MVKNQGDAGRQARLATALRDNLKKRKAQLRGRKASGDKASGDKASGNKASGRQVSGSGGGD